MKPIATSTYVGVDKRAAPRTDVYARLPLVMPDGQPAMVTAVNISADGILVRLDRKLDEGALVHLSMPVIGKVPGRAVWSLGGRSGINFIETIPVRDYETLLRALGARF